MTVYVDNMRAKFSRMIMCHMIADSEEELHLMADRIGVARKWYQGDHYDISLSKRKLAVQHGAVEITMSQLGCLSLHRRVLGYPGTIEESEAFVRSYFRLRRIRRRLAQMGIGGSDEVGVNRGRKLHTRRRR